MAKFIKSIFTSDNKITRYEDEVEEGTDVPPLDVKRKLSMSRSGRLKQSYKKRQQLSVAVYGGEDLHAIEKPKSKEYHVNTPATPKSKESKLSRNGTEAQFEISDIKSENDGSKSPDEEIDNAFEIIDKS